jgi:cephalosporin hydroxylase
VSLHEIGCTFLGVNCSQSWADFLFWERLLNARPGLRSIVELGTGEGGFSRYLAIQAKARGLAFSTFDHVHMDGQRADGFQMLDIFALPEKVVARFFEPTVLFCDNGDKPREVELFTPLLSPRSLVVVHDWNVEITSGDIPGELKPVHRDLWTATTAVFARI